MASAYSVLHHSTINKLALYIIYYFISFFACFLFCFLLMLIWISHILINHTFTFWIAPTYPGQKCEICQKIASISFRWPTVHSWGFGWLECVGKPCAGQRIPWSGSLVVIPYPWTWWLMGWSLLSTQVKTIDFTNGFIDFL